MIRIVNFEAKKNYSRCTKIFSFSIIQTTRKIGRNCFYVRVFLMKIKYDNITNFRWSNKKEKKSNLVLIQFKLFPRAFHIRNERFCGSKRNCFISYSLWSIFKINLILFRIFIHRFKWSISYFKRKEDNYCIRKKNT